MNAVQIEQKSYEMPPREGFTVAHFLTVADIDRSTRFYEKVFGGRTRSDRVRTLRTVKARPGWAADLNAYGDRVTAFDQSCHTTRAKARFSSFLGSLQSDGRSEVVSSRRLLSCRSRSRLSSRNSMPAVGAAIGNHHYRKLRTSAGAARPMASNRERRSSRSGRCRG
jgi:hypothetical protein